MSVHASRLVPEIPKMTLAFAKWDAANDAKMVGPDMVKEWLIERVEELEQAVLECHYAIRVLEREARKDVTLHGEGVLEQP